MSINAAKKFLADAANNEELRNSLNAAASQSQIKSILQTYDYVFTDEEFGDAYRTTLLGCQFEEQAESVKQLKLWWDFLLNYTPGNV